MSYFKVAVDWEVPWILNLAFLCFLLNTYTPGLVLPCTDSTAHNDLEWLIEVVKNTNITDISVHWDVWNWDVWKWLLIFVLPLRWLIFVDIWVKSLRWVILSDISVNYTEMSEIWTHLSKSTHINLRILNIILRCLKFELILVKVRILLLQTLRWLILSDILLRCLKLALILVKVLVLLFCPSYFHMVLDCS